MIKKILLFGGIGLVLVVVAGAVTLLFLAPKSKVVTTIAAVGTPTFQIGPTYTLPDRIVNLADPGASRYLKISIVLAFSPNGDSQSTVNNTITQRMTVL